MFFTPCVVIQLYNTKQQNVHFLNQYFNLRFYILKFFKLFIPYYLTTVFYVHIDIFKKFKYFILR